MQERLARDFVPVVGDTHALQTGRSPAAEWFTALARANVPRVRDGHTAQGFYAFSAGGAFLGYNNNRSVERVLALLDAARRAYDALPPEEVRVAPEAVAAAFCAAPPPEASIVRVYTRVRPLPADAPRPNAYLGRDFLWVRADELAAIAAAEGPELALPPTLAARIVRFHLVDDVRGEPPFWRAEEVQAADLRLVRDAEDPRAFRLTGRFALSTADGARGYEGTLEGALRLAPDGPRLARLRALARGEAWGHGPWTPNPPPGRFALAVALVEAAPDDAVARLVPPQAVACGQRYLDATLEGR